MAQQLFQFVLVAILAFSTSLVTAKNALNEREKRADDNGPLEAVVSQLSQTVTTMNAKLQAAETLINTLQADLSTLRNDHETKKGTGGGSDIHDSGSGSNQLCLSPDPVFDDTPILRDHAVLTGIQHYLTGHTYTDVTTLSATFMVPGTNRCPAHSVLQYHGYLVAGEAGNTNEEDFLCLDSAPTDQTGSGADQRPSGFLEHTVTTCGGSLACPPYQDNKVVTCAVCSM